jgi:ATP-binding cassette subfamily B protein/ATP-binding cassette subfamily C protein
MAAPAAGPVAYRRLLRWSLQIVGGAPRLFVASVLLGVIPIVLTQYSVWLLSRIIAALGPQQAVEQNPLRLALGYLAVSILVVALRYAGRIATIRANGAMLGVLQQRLHDRLLALPPGYHETHDVGETTTIVMQDARGCQPMLSELIAAPVTQGVTLVSALYFLFLGLGELRQVPVSAELLLVAALLALPPVGWWLSVRLRDAYDVMRSAESVLAVEFANSAAAPNEVRLLAARPQRARAFGRALANAVAQRIRSGEQTETANQFQTAVPSLLQAAILTYAAVAAASAGPAAAGAILPIFYFVPKVIEPVDQIIRFAGGLQMMWVSAARMGAVLDAPEPPATPPAAVDGPAPEVALERVTFAYPGAAAPTVDALSHVFPAGGVSAIVGYSGSGKSSLLSLIDGLLTPTQGSVRIGGAAVAAMGEAELRGTVAVVSQNPLFITDTVRANFQLACPDAAARAAGLWPALAKAGDSPLDVIVPRMPGQGLSGGERKRLAVARVLLRKPRVLLLDEATTGVDAASIGALVDTLRRVAAGMTVIMVDHNLDVVRALAHQVCCLENGRFSDIGTPDELAGRPSLFAALLAARERLTSTAAMDLQSVKPPGIAAGPAIDPWAGDQVPDQPIPKPGAAMARTALHAVGAGAADMKALP